MLFLSKKAAAKWFFARDYCNESLIVDPKGKPEFLECSLIGISNKDQLNYIEDMFIPKQEVTSVFTDLDNESFMDKQFELMDQGITIPQIQTWYHTHPASSANPSGQDKETWASHFTNGDLKFAGMGIISLSQGANCTYGKVSYDSYIGNKEEECQIVFELYPNKYYDISYIYDLQNGQEKHSWSEDADSIHTNLFHEFQSFHQEWFKEIKDNVTKEKPVVIHTQYQGMQNQYTGNSSGTVGSISNGKYQKHIPLIDIDNKGSIPNNLKKNVNTTKKDQKQEEDLSDQMGVIRLLKALIKNNKKTFNEFSIKNQESILKSWGFTRQEIAKAFKLITENEDKIYPIDMEDIDDDKNMPDLIDPKTLSSTYFQLKPNEIEKICLSLLIRPHKLKDFMNDYVEFFTNFSKDMK